MPRPNPINIEFANPPSVDQGWEEVVAMRFTSPRASAVWRVSVAAFVVVWVALCAAKLDNYALLGLVSFTGFAMAGVLIATRKHDQKTTECAQRILAAAQAVGDNIVELSLTVIALMSIVSVALPRVERRAPPQKIQQPTLYPRLASTPWPASA